MIIKRNEAGHPTGPSSPMPRFGLKETEIAHSRGLITKDEVRAVSVHALRLPDRGVLWDIGGGSGALSIEAARLCPDLSIFSIEKDPEQLALMARNRSAFAAANMTVVPGRAPEVLASLPSPDRVFVGGSGGYLEGIIDAIKTFMKKGIIVVNAATLDTRPSPVGTRKGRFQGRGCAGLRDARATDRRKAPHGSAQSGFHHHRGEGLE